MTETEIEIITKIVDTYRTEQIQFGAMYILPDGRLLCLNRLENGHSDLSAFLASKGIEKEYRQGFASLYLRTLGGIRINTKLRFIDLVDVQPTAKQYASLTEALRFMQDDIQVTANGKTETYKGKTAEEIIEQIKKLIGEENR